MQRVRRYDEQADLSVEKSDCAPSSPRRGVSVYYKVKMNKFEHVWIVRGFLYFAARVGAGGGRVQVVVTWSHGTSQNRQTERHD